MSSHFKSGYADRPESSSRKYQPRLYLPKDSNESKTIIIIDDNEGDPPSFWEHMVKIRNDWRNWFWCSVENSTGDECPLCDIKSFPYFIGAFTVIDRSEWTDKKGEVHKDEQKLLMAKKDDLGRMEARAKKLIDKKKIKSMSLVGCEYEISRSSGKASSIGDIWDLQRIWTEEELREEFSPDLLKALPYVEFFKDLGLEALQKAARTSDIDNRKGLKPNRYGDSRRDGSSSSSEMRPARRPTDEDEEEKPARRPREDEEEEEAPKPKKKAVVETSDEEERPKKKKIKKPENDEEIPF